MFNSFNNNNNEQQRLGGFPFPNQSMQDMSNLGGQPTYNNNRNGFGTYQNGFMQEPLVAGFGVQEGSIKNKTWHIGNVLTMLFGEGYSFNAVKVPSEEMFPEKIRHFDRSGFSYMLTQRGVYQSVGMDGMVVNVEVTYAVCHACRKVYYRIENMY